MKMTSPISRFVVDLCCEDLFIGIQTSHCDCPVDYPSNSENNTACLKKLFLCSTVD